MADNNNSSPGKRLRREEAKNMLYVSRPDDTRLKAYRDSLGLYNHANDYRNILLKNSISPIKNEIIIKNPDVLGRINQNIPYSKIMNDKIKPIAYYDIGVGSDKQYNESAIYKKPERPVVFVKRQKAEVIEPLAPRQATFTPQEMVAPVMRPEMRPADDFTAPKVGMGFALRYPSQDFLSRLKSRLTGEPLMPYWVDKEGIKRYPSRGESSPEAIRNIQMLKSGLNPNNPEDSLELKRIDELLKGKRK